jgi:hypothetical protein
MTSIVVIAGLTRNHLRLFWDSGPEAGMTSIWDFY